MGINRYRLIDLGILTLLMVLLECLIAFGRNLYPGEAYMLSVVLPVTLIVMMRWGAWGIVHALIGGLTYCVIYGGGVRSFIIYSVGNLGAALALPYLFKIGKKKIQDDIPLTLLYCFLGWLGMNLGRTMVSVILGAGGFYEMVKLYLPTDALNGAAAILIIIIARKQNGVFEDQLHYLSRLAREEKRKNEK